MLPISTYFFHITRQKCDNTKIKTTEINYSYYCKNNLKITFHNNELSLNDFLNSLPDVLVYL